MKVSFLILFAFAVFVLFTLKQIQEGFMASKMDKNFVDQTRIRSFGHPYYWSMRFGCNGPPKHYPFYDCKKDQIEGNIMYLM